LGARCWHGASPPWTSGWPRKLAATWPSAIGSGGATPCGRTRTRTRAHPKVRTLALVGRVHRADFAVIVNTTPSCVNDHSAGLGESPIPCVQSFRMAANALCGSVACVSTTRTNTGNSGSVSARARAPLTGTRVGSGFMRSAARVLDNRTRDVGGNRSPRTAIVRFALDRALGAVRLRRGLCERRPVGRTQTSA
jgi:hypothetical protein